jgi:ribosomal protein L40E
MKMKDCPSCGATVPKIARLCKHCFYDFQAVPKKKSNNLVGFLVLLIVLGGLGAGTFSYIYNTNAAEKIIINEETQALVFTRTSASGTTTQVVNFEDVSKLEYVKAAGKFEIVAVATDDSRHTIKVSEKPLEGYAEHIANVIDRPMVVIDNLPATTFAPSSN